MKRVCLQGVLQGRLMVQNNAVLLLFQMVISRATESWPLRG